MSAPPANAGALVGHRLGDYELVALLALGGTAEIYLARTSGHAGFEKYVVVKCLHDHLAYDPEFVQMFLDEARLGAQLDHSNCVQTLGLGEQDGRYYLVMEYVAGMSVALMARRAAERVQGARIPPTLVLGIAAQAAGGLHYAHERTSGGHSLNLVHRDISPQNLVVTFEGVVKIVDFGIAKAEERATATKAGTIKGKFAYMSPEQCVAKHVDRRTDVFALGVVTHELLTGRRLFKRNSTYETYQAILECKVPPPSAVNHELDPALDAVIMSALAKDANRRYPTAEAFGEAISAYLHRGHRHAGAGAISTFIEQFFQPEIADHGDRMRELIEGRGGDGAGWDDDEAEEISGEEVEDDDSHSGGGGFDAGAMGFEEVPTGTDQEGAAPQDSTRIEMNPMERLAELNERVRVSGAFPVPEMPTTIAQQAAVSGRAVPTTTPSAPTAPAAQPVAARRAEAVPEPVSPQKERSQPSVQVQFNTPPPTSPPPAAAAPAPAPARNPGPPQALFATAKPGGSIFGAAGPTKPGASIFGGNAAPSTPRPVTPAPTSSAAAEPLKIASLFGAPTEDRSKAGAVPAPVATPPRASRSQSITEPAPSRGDQTPPPSRAPVRADQTPPPSRPTASEAAVRGGAFGPAVVPTVIAEPEGTPSQRGPAAGPGQATMSIDLLEVINDLGNPAPTQAAVNATAAMASMDPMGSGSMPVPPVQMTPYGTPPGTAPTTDGLPPYFDPQTAMPAHLISLPGETYPNWDGTYQHPKRGLPPWALTLLLLGGIGIATVLIILIARG